MGALKDEKNAYLRELKKHKIDASEALKVDQNELMRYE